MDESNRLTPLQRDFLKAWFERTDEFFLTGGGALCGFYGLPRFTQDIDLFTLPGDAFARVGDWFHDCCKALEASPTAMVTSTHFRRYRVQRETEVTLVDFVEDLAPQVCSEKRVRPDGIRLDPPDEIAVNKVCAMVSRSEPRDFYDFHYLVGQGQDPDVALKLASQKDAGVNAETLAMILQSVDWDRFLMPGLDVTDSARFFQGWLERLILELHPDAS